MCAAGRCGDPRGAIRPGDRGDSEAVHGISDARLAEDGRPLAEVFANSAFLGDTPVAGHNVRFDRMLTAHSAWMHRCASGITSTPHATLVDSEAGQPSTGRPLREARLPAEATTVRSTMRNTVHLFFHLATIAQRSRAVRQNLMQQHAPSFEKLRLTLDRWAGLGERPGVLIHRILHEGGLLAYYRRRVDSARLAHLESLSPRIALLDDPTLGPIEATRKALEYRPREQDLLDQSEGVRVITIHQSKGLNSICPRTRHGGRQARCGARSRTTTPRKTDASSMAAMRGKKTLMLVTTARFAVRVARVASGGPDRRPVDRDADVLGSEKNDRPWCPSHNAAGFDVEGDAKVLHQPGVDPDHAHVQGGRYPMGASQV